MPGVEEVGAEEDFLVSIRDHVSVFYSLHIFCEVSFWCLKVLLRQFLYIVSFRPMQDLVGEFSFHDNVWNLAGTKKIYTTG